MDTMLFLWSSSSSKDSRTINLDFYDSEKQRIESLSVGGGKPYFLAPYPLSKEEQQAVLEHHGSVQEISKRDLFSDKSLSLAKVECLTPRLLHKLSKHFERSWENEIAYDTSNNGKQTYIDLMRFIKYLMSKENIIWKRSRFEIGKE